MSDTDDSDYIVEHFVRPDKIGAPLVNDESADILGNFDDQKRKQIQENAIDDFGASSDGEGDEDEEESDEDEVQDHPKPKQKRSVDEHVDDGSLPAIKKRKPNTPINSDGTIGEEQVASLLKGVSKANRLVLYVTNLNFATSKERLAEYFSSAGPVKAVRIPKKRKGGFAFIEMADLTGFKVFLHHFHSLTNVLNLISVSNSPKNAFSLHNSTLDERPIKVQLSEAGTKKSANKKNILKQKNRKLAEMRKETKSFTKSGKNYDKTIKKEIAKEQLQRTIIIERKKARRANKKKNNA